MRTPLRTLICAAGLFVPAQIRAQNAVSRNAIDFGVSDTDSMTVLRFIDSLKSAVERGDRVRVAEMIDYPIVAWDGARNRTISTRADFQSRYRAIFSPALRRAVAAVEMDSLFANWQGVMFDNGRVWFHTVAPGVLKIATINRPIDAAPRRDMTGHSTRPANLECLRFKQPLGYSASGALEQGKTEWYVLRLADSDVVSRPLFQKRDRERWTRRSRWTAKGDSIHIRVSDGLVGWDVALRRAGDGYTGVANYLSDARAEGWIPPRVTVHADAIECPAPIQRNVAPK